MINVGFKYKAYLPDVRVIVARAAGQELVVRADRGFHVKRGVLVATENRHCGAKPTFKY